MALSPIYRFHGFFYPSSKQNLLNKFTQCVSFPGKRISPGISHQIKEILIRIWRCQRVKMNEQIDNSPESYLFNDFRNKIGFSNTIEAHLSIVFKRSQ